MTDDARPLPRPNLDTTPFWAHLAAGSFRLQRCGDCGRLRFLHAPVCPFCSSRRARWEELSGGGALDTWTIIHRTPQKWFKERVPYAAGLMRLAEDPRVKLAGTIEIDDFGDLREGLPLQLIIEHIAPEVTLFHFEVVRESEKGA